MKIPLYFRYASHSLLRGGQRTILAIFCVAVGVMAVVALQLVGAMLQNSLVSNVRLNNDGDIALDASSAPLKPADLAFFTQLKKSGTITNYSAVIEVQGSLHATASAKQALGLEAVDPHNFPLVALPSFVQPRTGTLTHLLTQNQVIATQSFMDEYHKHLGDTFPVYVKTSTGSGQTLHVKLAGVITDTGPFTQAGNLLLIAAQDYLATAPTALHTYNAIHITTLDQAHTDAATKAINAHFPLGTTQTVAEILKSEQSSLDMINKFLEITGLLALLIGGVGIVNTMQVLLVRRKTEIAMLKTAGYRRRDLALLFGLEAGLLGLVGGIIGAIAATGVSLLVHNLLQKIGLTSTFALSLPILSGGVLIGAATALIFGLLPIVQAANIRPLSVIRNQERYNPRGLLLTFSLLVILSILFCLLATVILKNDLVLGIETTYGTLAFLLVLSTFFGLIVLIISKLPVPEHFHSKQLLWVLAGLILAVPASQVLPIFGKGLLAVSLLGLVVSFWPRGWKVNTKIALRNLGRQRARTTTTLLALFIGIGGIGLVVALGQDLQKNISNSLVKDAPYNLVVTTSGQDTSTLHTRLHTIPGLTSSREDTFTTVLPSTIDGQPLQQVLPTGNERQIAVALLSQIEGYSLTPSSPALTMSQGRSLNASDATTNHVIISALLTNIHWSHVKLQVGSTLTLLSANGQVRKTVTVVGIIAQQSSTTTLAKILTPSALINTLNPPQNGAHSRSRQSHQANTQHATTPAISTVFYIKVASAQLSAAQDALGRIVPNASVQNLTDATSTLIQQLNNVLDVLVALASLSMLAAMVIIANTVALAMLERRREMGILKAIGSTSGAVLSGILIENGIVGAVGAFIATLLAAGGVTLLGNQVFNLSLHMSSRLVIGLIGGAMCLAMFIALLVAWNAVRVRPLEVLRYE